MKKFNLDISTEKNRFENHIQIDGNNQIIFSGIFGIGKTFFLNKFFGDKKDKYETIILSPVNYSISNDDDIVDFIKYDIIFQLLEKGINFEKTDFSKGLTSQMYLKDNFKEVMKILLKNASKINKQFGAIFSSLNQINIEIEKHQNDINIDEQKELIDFLTTIKDKTGSIYEENRITCLIAKLIEDLKTDGKQVVLVIDDTDRLDPEHIFRILNVFACHFEFGNIETNKFNFDKIILVCDVENIRKMFHSKYGQNVDFSGYIDKFYGQEIFYFDNKKVLKENLYNILDLVVQDESDLDDFYLLGEKYISKLLRKILSDMISTDSINLRTLLNLSYKKYQLPTYYFKLEGSNSKSSNRNFDVFLIFDFLTSLFGSKVGLNSVLIKLNNELGDVPVGFDYEIEMYGDIIRFLKYRGEDYRSEEKVYSYSIESLNIIFTYQLTKHVYNVYLRDIKISYLNKVERKSIPLYQMLSMAFKKYSEVKGINN